MLTLLAVFSSLAFAQESVDEAPLAPPPPVEVRERKRTGLRLDVGFPHIMSDAYRTPLQARSASFGVGVTPGILWLELVARWEWMNLSVDPSHPDFSSMDGLWVDFTSVGAAWTQEFFRGDQSLRIGVSALVVLPRIAGQRPTVGWAGGYQMYYLFQVKNKRRIGPFVDIRENKIRLRRPDGTLTDSQVDASYSTGCAFFF